MRIVGVVLIVLFVISCQKDDDMIESDNCSVVKEQCEIAGKRPLDIQSNLSRLRTVYNAIVNGQCSCVQLKGVVIEDPYFLFHENVDIDALLKTLKNEWNVSIIRVPIHPGLYQQDESYLSQYVDEIVELANQYEIYVYLGWHAQGNIATGTSFVPDWSDNPPWNGNPYNVDLELAKRALKEMAQRYQHMPWVVYGIFNEPALGITWETFHPFAEQLVDVVQGVDAENLVFVGGTNFGYELGGIKNRLLQRPHVVYETHPYPQKGETWKTDIVDLQQVAPVFIGEWGFCDESSSEYCSDQLTALSGYAKDLLSLIAEHNIGYCAWIYSDDWTPNLISADSSRTNFGNVVWEDLIGD